MACSVSDPDPVGGGFASASGTACNSVGAWDGAGWAALGQGNGVNGTVGALAVLPDGDLLAAGTFEGAGATICRVGRWDGNAWQDAAPIVFVPGVSSSLDIRLVAPLADGGLVIGGLFQYVGGVACSNIARWDGASWTPFGQGLNGTVYDVVELPNGNIVAAGLFELSGTTPVSNIALWDGAQWLPMGDGLGTQGQRVFDLGTMPNGDIVACGEFSFSGATQCRGIARWDGATWSSFGSGLNAGGGRCLILRPGGDLIAAGSFSQAGGVPCSNVARWNGVAWSALGAGTNAYVNSLALLPNGDLVAGGVFTQAGGVSVERLARWNGTNWSDLGGGVTSLGGFAEIEELVWLPSGDLVVAGIFDSCGGHGYTRLGFLSTDCPATAIVQGAGSVGTGGADMLTAVTSPWIGSTLRTEGSGLPSVAIVLSITGFAAIAQGSVPLTGLLPMAVPGADLLVQPDLLDPLITLTGQVEALLPLPNAASLVGASFYQQMISIGGDQQGNWTEVSTTNALHMVVGSY